MQFSSSLRLRLWLGFALTWAIAGVGPISAQIAASRPAWRRLDNVPADRPAAERWVNPERFTPVTFDHAALREELRRAPQETVPGLMASDYELTLPMPDGTSQRFRVMESSVMAPELAAKFPELKTYLGQGVDDPTATVRFDLTPAGFHAQILSASGAVYIDPLSRDRSAYAVYYKRDHRRLMNDFQCLTADGAAAVAVPETGALARSGGNLRTYQLACATTGEYTAYHGGTVSAGLAAVVTAINRINGVYETELAVRLVLVANNDQIIYTSSGTDPYNNSSGSTMLTQNQSNLDLVIGNANYDLGHVFSTGGGGIAVRAGVCVTGSKARGVTGSSSPTGDAFWIDYVAHEMGHQLGANHTFNSTTGNCGGSNRNGATAYEPGSGSTIMAYAGICGSDDLQPHSDPYFHSISFDEILVNITSGSGSSCPVVTSTGNSAPTVEAGPNYTIPARTPFLLTASGSDPNGDPLTFCWEERDLGPSTTLTAPDNGSSPLFRVFNPSTNAWRTFPKLADILNNTATLGERLPTTSRTLNFRVTARDNRAGAGGVNTDDMGVTVVATAGPFTVTAPASPGVYSNALTVTWTVANTTAAPINCANVKISLSTNGGLSFPLTLLESTPNDGSEIVPLPNLNTAQARIRVQGADNIFFDINPANFTIVPGVPAPVIIVDSVALTSESCGPGNNAIDPGETVTVAVGLRNVGTANTTNLVATLLSAGGVTIPSGPQAYGMLTAGGLAVLQSYTFAATGACGGAISPLLSLEDGPTALGTLGWNQTLGGFVSSTALRTNSTAISIPATGNKGKGGPYPSTITVSGLAGALSKVTVTLDGVGHTFPDDMDILLVGPGGQKVMLLSDVGEGNSVSGLTLTFDDAAGVSLPDNDTLVSGVYLPTDYDPGSDVFPAPAPLGPYGTSLGVFNGLDPNGTWSLYTLDDQQQDTGAIAQGWRLSLTTAVGNCCGVVANRPPTLSPIETKAVAELQTLTFTNSALDPDANLLTFSLIGAPTNAVIDPASGQFSWTPGEEQGPSTNQMFVVVTDDGSPSLSATQTLTIVVSEVNVAPMLFSISDWVVVEGELLQFTNLVQDPDVPANGLTFSLAGGSTNAAMDPVTGVFAWSTGELDGPGTNLFAVLVADNGTPSLSSTQYFTVTVLESNQPPTLAPIADRLIHAGGMLVVTNSATDPDWPPNLLGYTLDAGAPADASVDTHGVLVWSTTDADAGTVNAFNVRVADDGTPSLDATQSFTVTVVARPVLTRILFQDPGLVMTWTAIAGEEYQLQQVDGVTSTNWVDVGAVVMATGSTATTTNFPGVGEGFYRVRWLAP